MAENKQVEMVDSSTVLKTVTRTYYLVDNRKIKQTKTMTYELSLQ